MSASVAILRLEKFNKQELREKAFTVFAEALREGTALNSMHFYDLRNSTDAPSIYNIVVHELLNNKQSKLRQLSRDAVITLAINRSQKEIEDAINALTNSLEKEKNSKVGVLEV